MKKLLVLVLVLFASCNDVESSYPNNKASPENIDVIEPVNRRINIIERRAGTLLSHFDITLVQIDSTEFLIFNNTRHIVVKQLHEK